MRASRIARAAVLYALLAIAFVIFVFPFFLLLVNSFKNNGQILENPFSLPTSFHFDQIADAFHKMEFGVTFTNTLIVTVCSVIVISVFSSMTAYYMVRKRSGFNQFFFALLVASMVIPFQSLMIPLMYIYGAKINLIGSVPIPALILFYLGFGSSLSVFIYHGFIKSSIPLELEEASYLDGCTVRQTFLRVVLPMLAPITATIAILNIMWIWNDYLLPSLVLTEPNVYTMPIQMKVFSGTYMNNWQLLIPAILMVIAPILVVYLFAQRYVISGVTQGAIK